MSDPEWGRGIRWSHPARSAGSGTRVPQIVVGRRGPERAYPLVGERGPQTGTQAPQGLGGAGREMGCMGAEGPSSIRNRSSTVLFVVHVVEHASPGRPAAPRALVADA